MRFQGVKGGDNNERKQKFMTQIKPFTPVHCEGGPREGSLDAFQTTGDEKEKKREKKKKLFTDETDKLSHVLPFCVCLWKVTRATASPAKSPASVSGPGRRRWRRFPVCPYARTPFWTCRKSRTGCHWTACTVRSGCSRRRGRPARAWRPATARPPRLSRRWRAAPRAGSPGTPPTSRRQRSDGARTQRQKTKQKKEILNWDSRNTCNPPPSGPHPAPPIWGFLREDPVPLPLREAVVALRCGAVRRVLHRGSSSAVSAVQECAPLKAPRTQQRFARTSTHPPTDRAANPLHRLHFHHNIWQPRRA